MINLQFHTQVIELTPVPVTSEFASITQTMTLVSVVELSECRLY